MKISEFSLALIRSIEQLNQNRERDAILATRDGIALAKLRVINKGTRADGAQFKPYSKNPIPFFWLGSSFVRQPDFNVAAAKARLKQVFQKKNAGKPKEAQVQPSYFDWRQITGRVTSFKNFSFTNDMWASIREFVKAKTATRVTIEVRSSYAFYNDTVIPAHNNREKINILQLAPTERGLVFQAYRRRRFDVLRQNGLIK